MSRTRPALELDLEALAAEAAEVLDGAPAGELIGAKLSRLLHAFLADEVRPQAERAAGLGIGPTPLLALVADVLRLYADALDHGSRPIAHGPQGDADGQLGLLPGRPARAGTVHLGEFTSW